MIVTEKEAKEMWCPAARVIAYYDHNAVAYNRNSAGGTANVNHCIGSKCMWWRRAAGLRDEGPRGYCGMAGKP